MKDRIKESRFFSELFEFNPLYAVAAVIILATAIGLAVYLFFSMAPPKHIVFASGPEGSMFHQQALEYQKFLKFHSVKVEVLTSKGSIENFDLLSSPSASRKVDVAFVQSGLIDPENDQLHDYDHLVSLGSVANMPLLLFYRGAEKKHLSELKGLKIAIGAPNSGTFKIATELLRLNGFSDLIDKNDPRQKTSFKAVGGRRAIEELKTGEVDAAFVMGEKVSLDAISDLLQSEEYRLFDFRQRAKAYTRKLEYLNTFDLPEGIVDLGDNLPPKDVVLLGPTVELLAQDHLHPAISDLLLDAAMQIHYKPNLFQKRGAFPTATAHMLPLSQDAQRFYQSGRGLLYRHLPFWLASLISRSLFVVLPILFILLPAIQALPWLYRWKNQLRLRRLYNKLMRIEKEYRFETARLELDRLQREFAIIDQEIQSMKVKPAYAEQFYHLRKHIDYVRRLISARV